MQTYMYNPMRSFSRQLPHSYIIVQFGFGLLLTQSTCNLNLSMRSRRSIQSLTHFYRLISLPVTSQR